MSLYGVIYSAFCTVTGKYYIGQTIHPFEDRKRAHLTPSRQSSRYFARAINKYGKEAFVWKILSEIHQGQQELNDAEEYWVKELQSLAPNGYNLKDGGGAKGKLSDETKALMSEIQNRPEIKERNRLAHLGKPGPNKGKFGPASSMWGKKNPNAGRRTGMKASPETIKRLSESHKGQVAWNKGKTGLQKHSEETRKKMSLSHMGKKKKTNAV